MHFQLHPQLTNDTITIGDFTLSRVLLMNDNQYPWVILVPRRAQIREIYQLNVDDQQQLQIESCLLSKTMQSLYQADKMNIAAIGNLVPQLHLHHVARYQHDATWPAPVWGKLPMQPYSPIDLKAQIQRLKTALASELSA